MAPVVSRAGPLRDDFDLCTSPRWNSGLGRAVAEILPETGAVRLPGRLAQVFVVSSLCGRVPFWVLILVPLVLTLAVGALLLHLLADLGVPPPWPHLGAAVWLLQPLGTESALWAVQFNIPLGLLLALLSLLAFRRQRLLPGLVAALAAYGLVEQVIFGLPLAVWLLGPAEQRRRVALWTGGLSAAVLLVYSGWAGYSERTAVGVAARLLAPFRDLGWYVEYPVVSLGLHSTATAVAWALPGSVVLVAALAALGALGGPRVLGGERPSGEVGPGRGGGAGLILLVVLTAIPMLTTVPHPASPRTFTPIWLILSGAVAVAGARVRWRSPALAGGLAGVLVAGALLSLALSSWVRVHTADFTEASSLWLARELADGESVMVCDVPRTVVEPAPAGDFAVHELIHPWAAGAAVLYYTGKEVSVHRGPLAPEPCARGVGVDHVVPFEALVRSWRGGEAGSTAR